MTAPFSRRLVSLLLAFSGCLGGGSTAMAGPLEEAAAAAGRELRASVDRLEQRREAIAAEKAPLAARLAELREQVARLRRDVERSERSSAAEVAAMDALRRKVSQRREEVSYLSQLLADYVERFHAQVHIAELQRYEAVARAAREASLSAGEEPSTTVVGAQLEVLRTGLKRLAERSGGSRFEGHALSPEGILEEGTFVLVGPVAHFASGQAGGSAGLVRMEAGSAEPVVYDLGPEAAKQIRDIAQRGEGWIPIDPTLGDAIGVASTEETFWEHVQKGGVVLYFILALAAAAAAVTLYKWVEISGARRVRPEELQALLDALRAGDRAGARDRTERLKGPAGLLLADGVEHYSEDKATIEEVFHERLLRTQPELERLIPFVAVTAATAPLLGLLGTVTGMIKTFKLIAVFGTGNASGISAGISEALITTEFGLLVAIPALIAHALLTRHARGVLASMEQTAVAFLNGIPTAPPEPVA